MNQPQERPGILEQVVVPVLRAGRGLSLRTWGLTLVYLLLAASLVGLVAYLGLRGRPALIDAFNTYIFPETWHGFSSRLVALILERVPPTLWINGVVLIGLQLAALTLFPLKEYISLAVERERQLVAVEPDEFPLWRQGFEETKLLVVNIALGGLILWLGYSTSAWRRELASVLSHLHLAAFFAVDFMAPLAQRHRASIEQILLAFAKRPVRPLLFGLLLTAPSSLITHAGGQGAVTSVLIIFAANAVPMAWGVLAGTRLMSMELERVKDISSLRRRSLVTFWSVAGLLVIIQGSILGALVSSIHAKSQVLKCDYSLPMDGFRVDTPNWLALVSGKLELSGYLTVSVNNPTQFDLEMEKNRLEVAVDGSPWWEGSVPVIKAPAGQETRVKVPFAMAITAQQVLKGASKGWSKAKELWTRVSGVFKRMDSPSSLVDQAERTIAATQLRFEAARQRVAVTLYIEILPGFEFPIFLLSPP